MLDVIAPEDKIGYCQGMNNTVMNLGMAVSPWVFGILADALGTNTAIWIGVGVSFFAGLANAPLMRVPGLGAETKKEPLTRRPLKEEDEEVVERALNGEWVDPAVLVAMNKKRALNGLPVLMPRVASYEDDKTDMDQLRARAYENFLFRREANDEILASLKRPEKEADLTTICEQINTAMQSDSETANQTYDDLGKWFADYIRDNGYHAQTKPLLIKQYIVSAFPRLMEGDEVTPTNLEQTLLNERQLANHYLKVEEERKYGWSQLLASRGGTPVTYFS